MERFLTVGGRLTPVDDIVKRQKFDVLNIIY